MASKKQFAQTTRETPSVPMKKTLIAPTLLPVCCICRHIRDETEPSPDREHWVTQRTYRKTYGVNPADCPLTHTYWPEGITKFPETVRQNVPDIGMSL